MHQNGISSFLDSLGVIGMSSIEPVILAALITAEPLLLIGPHGTGKSFLLNRISRALGFTSRHYNASLLNFDDLVGYPLPNGNGQLEYVRTPAAIWGAQTVFLDEISRCRPDMQNKLFPIIHDKKVQGIDLTDLVYRWSAMNPPRSEDEPEAVYIGSEPLDSALADRFSFVVEMPTWDDFSEDEQATVIRSKGDAAPLGPNAGFADLVDRGRKLFLQLDSELGASLVLYIRLIVGLLAKAGLKLSPRRSGMLLRNLLAVYAANCLLRPDIQLNDSALLALTHSLPQPAQGMRVDRVKLLAAHREAWKAAQPDGNKLVQAVFMEIDPLRKVMKASLTPALSQTDYSSVVADALASLPAGGRHALALRIFESAAAGRLVAAVAEQCAELFALVTTSQEVHENVTSKSPRHKTWQHLVEVLARLDPGEEATVLKTNLLCGLFSTDQLAIEQDVDRALAEWERVFESVSLPGQSGWREAA
jgi:MoxR-like ATPase